MVSRSEGKRRSDGATKRRRGRELARLRASDDHPRIRVSGGRCQVSALATARSLYLTPDTCHLTRFAAGRSLLGRALAFAAVLIPGCTYRVTPPANPAAPMAVYVVDYGQHSSLVLPAESGEMREYAYGEWEWFAKNDEAWWRGPLIMVVPSRGALGMRPAPFDLDEARGMAPGSGTDDGQDSTLPQRQLHGVGEAVHEIQVDAARAAALRERLDRAFREHSEAAHFNQRQSMVFVPHERRYWCAFHCNSATAEWLRELECVVQGGGCVAEFRIEQSSPLPCEGRRGLSAPK